MTAAVVLVAVLASVAIYCVVKKKKTQTIKVTTNEEQVEKKDEKGAELELTQEYEVQYHPDKGTILAEYQKRKDALEGEEVKVNEEEER